MRRTPTFLKLMLLAIVTTALVFSAAAVAFADDIYVDAFLGDDVFGDGSMADPYASIETALATATAGDDIYVASGIYSENATLTAGVDIWGAGAASTFVSSAGGDHIFYASNVDSATVDGLAIVGGYGPVGAGMLCEDSTLTVSACTFASNDATDLAAGGLTVAFSDLQVTDCDFEDNTGWEGGALFSLESSLTVTGSTFTNNQSFGDGGAIAIVGENLATILGNTFTSNKADSGGAIGINWDNVGGSEVRIESNTITGNSAVYDGGGVSFSLVDESDDNTATVSMNTVSNNTAGDYGGGLSYYLNDSWSFVSDVTSNTITDNTAGEGGGGIAHMEEDNTEGQTTLAGNTIARNDSFEGAGIGVAFIDSGDLDLLVEDNTITENTAIGDAGGIGINTLFAGEIDMSLTGNTISDNDANDGGGGGVMLYQEVTSDTVLLAYDNVIERNYAKYDGGGVYFYTDPNCEFNSFDIEESTVASNVAGVSGAGIWAKGDGDDAYVGIYESTVADNFATDNGGGMYLEDVYSEVGGNTITSNNTPERGGGVFCTDSSVGFYENTVSENTSGKFGGGIAMVDCEFGMFGNDFLDNFASGFGGGLGANWCAGEVDGNTFAGNTARNGGGAAEQGDWVDFYNNVFDSNVATDTGGGLYVQGDMELINNTYVGNDAMFGGDGIQCDAGSPIAANNIFWDHDGSDFSGLTVGSSITFQGGPGNFWADPMFRDEAGGDYRLLAGSPAIDSALATIPPSATPAPDHDFDGEVRPQDGDGDLVAAWDRGAFEMPVQTAPVSVDDTFTVEEDALLWPPVPGVLANDTDINGDSLLAFPSSTTSDGALALFPNGSFVYQPDPDWFGTDTFNYVASDGTSLSAPATVTITVTPVNDPPVAVEDTATCAEDTSATVNVLDNDYDIEGDTLTASLTVEPSNGDVTLDTSGTAVYTPDPDYNGVDMFWYVAFDGQDYSDPATVTVTVTPVNDPPVASDVATSCAEDTSATVNVLDNDYDADGDSLTASLTVNPSNGAVTLDTSGTAIYTPNPNWFGIDTFNYMAYDGQAYSNQATVTVTVTPVNDPPVASDVTTSCAEDTFAIENVLDYVTDIENDPLTAEKVTDPSNGTATVAPSGEMTYTPDPDWFGIDSFTYRAHDGEDYSNVATVTITVTWVNDPPVASDETTMCAEDTSATVDVLANATDVDGIFPLTAEMVTGAANGTVTVPADGMAVYTPDPDWFGTDTFTYRAYDSMDYSNVAVVTVVVTPVNDAPVSVEDTYTVEEDGMLIVPASGVLGNDTDIENDPLTADLVSGVSSGTLVFSEQGSLVYTPNADFYGTDIFFYRAYDGDLYSQNATVTITVTPVNDVPVSADDTATCAEDTFATFNVLDNDFDADPMDILTAQVWSSPDHGTVTVAPSGEATYTPDPDWHGNDTFVYRAYDGTVYSALALVSIEVWSVNDTPTAMPEDYSTTESTMLTVDAPGVLGNDTDVDGDSLTATPTADVSNGTLALAADGSFTYMPDAGFWGTDEFAYSADDGALVSTPVTVTITVDDVTPPTTTSDAVPTYGAFATITLDATDTASGVAMTYFSLDGAAAEASTTVFTDILGTHTLSFWSVDVAGNVEDATEVTFHVGAVDTAYETIAGPDRYVTAIEASKKAFPDGASTVVVATGQDWPDALGGAALAGVKNGPVLLSLTGFLQTNVAAEVTRLGATDAYVLGGTGALSPTVVSDLEGLGLTVTRLGGVDRYATARLVAAEVVAVQGPGVFDGQAFMSTGYEYADALAAGPAAAKMGWPVYLTRPTSISDVTLRHMVDQSVEKVIMLGGTGALETTVEDRLNKTFGAGDVSRIFGATRYQTAISLAGYTVNNTPLIWDGVAFATGQAFPDALAAGPMQAQLGSVLLLTPTNALPDYERTFLIGKRDDVDTVLFMGGTAAITPAVRTEIGNALR